MTSPPVSPTLAADAMVASLRAEGRPVYHMGFGQAPFPAPPRIAAALQDFAHEKHYMPVAGLPELRHAVAKHQCALAGIDSDGVDVLVAPGSKLILYAVQMAISGDLVLPVPSWVSYQPQAAMLGQQTIPLATRLDDQGYHIDLATLEKTVLDARSEGLNPTKIMLNYPNNPTGLTIPADELAALAASCESLGLIILADEIYGRLVFAGPYQSIAKHAPDRTIISTGLSKHCSLGGWRLGVGLIPRSIPGLFDTLQAIASETWSCVAAPIQIAAIEAWAGHDDIETFVSQSTRIHHEVTSYIVTQLNQLGLSAPLSQGGFYVWPMLDAQALPTDAPHSVFGSSAALANALVAEQGIVALPGAAFGEHASALKLRLSACDYDGAVALQQFATLNTDALPDVASYAPNVVAGMEAFAAFAKHHGLSA